MNKSNIAHWFSRRTTLGFAACLVAFGCGSEPESPGTSSSPAAPRGEEGAEALYDEFPVQPERIAAELEIRGSRLILSLENLTDVGGTVRVSSVVENAGGI